MSSLLHPLFASILAVHGMPQDGDISPVRRAAYVAALKRMDWRYEATEDHQVWRSAVDELQRLRIERAAVDPDGSLWLRHAPAEFHAEIAR